MAILLCVILPALLISMKLTIYRVLTFLLIPVAVLFGVCILILISAAVANPAILIPLFLMACITIYTFAALSFLIKGVDGQKQLKNTLRELLRVNAFISIAFALLLISECIILITHPEMTQSLMQQAKQNTNTELKLDDAAISYYMRITSYFFLVYALVLSVHILLSFQYMKQYNYLFVNAENDRRKKL